MILLGKDFTRAIMPLLILAHPERTMKLVWCKGWRAETTALLIYERIMELAWRKDTAFSENARAVIQG